MFSDDQENQQPYHHGNVKEALIGEAMKFIEANETEQLSLRRLAKEVGISPSAVYNHFPDKNALMLAIKARLYSEFNQYYEAQCQEATDPKAAILEMCLAYYYFSQEQPARFQILFASTLPMEWSSPEMVDIACQSIIRLRKLVLEIYHQYQVPCSEEALVDHTLLIWSQLHGIVSLKNTGGIKAAVTYQNWPQTCALVHDQDVKRLIKNHVDNTVQSIMNAQYNDSHH